AGEARDVAKLVWLRLVEHRGELRKPLALPKWLVVTTHNECRRWLRAARRVRPFDPLEADPDWIVDHATPDEWVLQAELVEALLAAMAELSDRQRALLWAFALEPGISYAEVSRRLGIPVGSIGPTLIRAEARMRTLPVLVALSDSGVSADDVGGGRRDIASAGRG